MLGGRVHTFLFTDIAGSSRQWESEPHRMHLVVERHHAIVREAVERHGGVVFKSLGDGQAAVFGSAVGAILAAQEAQIALQEILDGAGVKMAIHTGQADLVEGDYMGSAVNRVARICDLASPGQVLVSDVALELADGVHPGRFETCVLRHVALDGHERPEMLHILLGEGLNSATSERLLAAAERKGHQPSGHPFESTPADSVASDLEPSGGAVPLNSRFYVHRPADDAAKNAAARRESIILIHGPRQVGKSSLLARLVDEARRDCAVATIDLQTLGKTQIQDEVHFYQMLAYLLAKASGVDLDPRAHWNDWLGPNMNLDSIVSTILQASGRPLCWALDEVDCLFGLEFSDDFFGLLRSWHNRRAIEPGGPFSNLTLLLSYATEAHLFIRDLSQSPFNVGVRVSLGDFTEAEVAWLAVRYGQSPGVAHDVLNFTQGHPFLTRRALACIADGGSMGILRATAARDDGPFADHLHRLLIAISQEPEMLHEVQRLLRGEALQNPTSGLRLWAAGVLDGGFSAAMPRFRVPVYEQYLRRVLAKP